MIVNKRKLWIISGMVIGLILSTLVIVVSSGLDNRIKIEPQLALNTIETACTSQVDFEGCASEVIETLDTDWLTAGKLLTTTAQEVSVSRFNIFCHTMSHLIGKKAAASGEMRIPKWALLCEGGYAHGVVAIEFDGESVDSLIDRSLSWCNEVSNSPGAVYSCAHIIGHELWERAGSSSKLVSECSRLKHPDGKRSETTGNLLATLCKGGVYMEYFQSAENQRNWIRSGASASTNDVLRICLEASVENGRRECLAMSFPALVLTSQAETALGKGEDGVKRCAELAIDDQEDCVIGVVAVTYSNIPSGAKGVEPLCAILSSTKGACYRQLAIATARDSLNLEKAIDVCNLPSNPNSSYCREFVQGWIERNVTGDDIPTSLLASSAN